MGKIRNIVISMRPRQWTKNVVIFAALIFAQHDPGARDIGHVLRSFAGFALFCLVSGAVYLFNDVIDAASDRTHPVKKLRPVASGALSPGLAVAVSVLLAVAGIGLSYWPSVYFGIVVSSYYAMQVLYGLFLKRVVLLDVFVIALGFVLRAVAGAYIIEVEISPWLLVCTLFLALFLALGKRRHEVMLLEQGVNSRNVLRSYDLDMLDQMINIVASGTVISYALYTLSESTVTKFHTWKLVFTVPFVLFGIFRYLYLVHKKMEGGSPEKILLSDVPMIVNILLYGATSAAIIYLVGK